MDQRFRMRYELGPGLILGGNVGRIDLIPQGYRAVLLETVSSNWDQALRMPLIQRGVADAYGRPEEEFWVAAQDLNGSNLQLYKYSTEEIDAAVLAARDLAGRVLIEVANQQGV